MLRNEGFVGGPAVRHFAHRATDTGHVALGIHVTAFVQQRVVALRPVELTNVHGQPTGVLEQFPAVGDQAAVAAEMCLAAIGSQTDRRAWA